MQAIYSHKKLLRLTAAILLFLPIAGAAQTNAATEQKIAALLKRMTLEEKIGQMAQITLDVLVPNPNAPLPLKLDPTILEETVVKYKIGSILNNAANKLLDAKAFNELIATIQNAAGKTPLKIPVLYGLDDIHGVNYVKGATLFPHQLGQAATWNRELVYKAAVITAYESRAAGVPWNFSPVLDLGTNPVWPRIWEGYGEDPYLVTEMGLQALKGYQNPLGHQEKVVASLKHFLAYSDPKSGRDRTDAWIPEHYLREYHLPAFEAAIKAGARNVMVNSALINGVPTHINKQILTELLKKELGFTGFVVTDWQDIENVFKRDRAASSTKEAIMLAINAGIDMAMIPYDYKNYCRELKELVQEGKIPLSRIDDAVKRILRVKTEIGLFEKPVTYAADYPLAASDSFKKASYLTAAESITLLKNNNGILPVTKGRKILVTGPNAHSLRTLHGGWSYTWQGERTDEWVPEYHTILEAMELKFGKENIVFEEGVAYKNKAGFNEDSAVNISAAVEAARNVDYILLCLGENSYTETPGNLSDLHLSPQQISLAKALGATGKPIVLILNEGRPRIIREIEPLAQAILHVYLPGNFGADALADILNGSVNPSGKLPITYPRFSNALSNYIHKPSDGPGNPQGGEFNPQFRFGEGLSYTHFSYSHLTIHRSSFKPSDSLIISVTVTNTGSRKGKEVVQLYVSDEFASITPDVERLRRFNKIELEAGESKEVTFILPAKELAFVQVNGKKTLEKGNFIFRIEKLKKEASLISGEVF